MRLKMAALAVTAVTLTLVVLLFPTYARVRSALARGQGDRHGESDGAVDQQVDDGGARMREQPIGAASGDECADDLLVGHDRDG
ncbi:MAG: hypothetical protein JF589_16355, partial [Gemmatimonadetes bacterium]|nr:hypothetical protein [Gemmatimonadota bacterium]